MKQSIVNRSTSLRSFITATWLGWAIESNWADPFLFLVYSIVKPLAGAGIIVIMYGVISKGNFGTPLFAYIFIGNAFYQYVGAVMTGVSWAIIDDREHYKTLKYIYTAPVSVPWYLLGRGVSRFLIATFSVTITLAFGMIFLKLPIDLAVVDWGLLILTIIIGVIMLSAIGILLAGITLLTARQSFFVGDVVAGIFYLFCGVIFPIELLMPWMRPIGLAIPVTYWTELLRRAMVGTVAEAFPTFTGMSNGQLMLILIGSSIIFSILSIFVFRVCDQRARELGLIDWSSSY
jgi:ABC-2 type transport system permease protein